MRSDEFLADVCSLLAEMIQQVFGKAQLHDAAHVFLVKRILYNRISYAYAFLDTYAPPRISLFCPIIRVIYAHCEGGILLCLASIFCIMTTCPFPRREVS